MTGMIAPMVLDGPINGDWFEAYVRQVLVPDLRCDDVVIKDNLSSHKRVSVREAVEAVGARLLFLPPYSPDSDPIEKAFSPQGHAPQGWRADRVRAVVPHRKLVDLFQPQECVNYFSSCGYDPDRMESALASERRTLHRWTRHGRDVGESDIRHVCRWRLDTTDHRASGRDAVLALAVRRT